ncbi:MAG: di-heme oxidoredictase family protein [Phycisphaerales bacterium]
MRFIVVSAVTAVAFCAPALAVDAQPKAGAPLPDLTPAELALFNAGKAVYQVPLTEAAGLGPIFNKAGCMSCHTSPLGGWGSITVTHFGNQGPGINDFTPLPGEVQSLAQAAAINGGCAEVIPEGVFTTTRVTNSSMAFGMIEAIPDADIAANEDPNDLNGDGISGRVHWVHALEDLEGAPLRAGRFGWKAQVPTVLTFSADASRNEMGLTNRFVPDENPPNGDYVLLAQCDNVPDPEDVIDGDGYGFIDRVTHFQRYLGVPPQTPRSGMQGEALFASVGCTKCHIPTWTTSNSPTLETALRGKTIHPYSDFLLHDMGLLADGVVQGDANEHELRTPTLWNLRTRDPMLHNSAAAGDTFENRVVVAIQAHGPFGEGAASAAAFANLSASDQAALVRFLGSLGRLEFDDDGSGGIDVVDLIGFEFCLNAAVTPEDPCAVHDVNQDGVVDLADFDVFLTVYEGVQGDCNFNGQNDLIDILLGLAEDADFDGIPDACACLGDANGDSVVDGADIGAVLGNWGATGGPADFNLDGIVDGADLGIVIGNWGSCI